MSTTTRRPTVAEAMAAVGDLHRQVVRNQETLDAKMSGFDKEVRATLDQWSKRNVRDRDALSGEFDELKTSVTKKHGELTGRIEEIGGIVASVKQATETSRETTLEIKRTVDALQDSLSKSTIPEPLPGVTTIGWDSLQKNPWYPWLKFAACCVLGVLAYHYLLVPALSRNIAPNTFPNLLRPSIDVHSPYGAATVEVSREPFRSDGTSRAAFGRIFGRLDELVRAGQLTEFEGYYNEFGREMQRAIPGNKYGQWADLWNRLALVCHRHGNGANDLRTFNANLQSAARAVSGHADFSSTGPHDGYDFGTVPVTAGATTPGTGQPNQNIWPFLQRHP